MKRYNHIPIKVYNVVQTGPKTQAGGLKNGLLSVVYQVGISGAVKIDPMAPASWHTETQARSTTYLG